MITSAENKPTFSETPDALSNHSHEVMQKTGAALGTVAGTTLGAIVAGPIGAGIGALTGFVCGAITGRLEAAMFDPSAEEDYWLKHHATQP